jgi:mannitol/fructose-specific phosphotransferase system IIA component (Ntr-type)
MGLGIMRIEDVSGKDLMVERLHSGSAAEAFGELLETISARRNLQAPLHAVCLSAIVERHRKVPCGLARGLAFPNARLREIPRPFMAVGMSVPGLELGGIDGSLSRIILLYLGRAPVRADEREMLGRLSLALTDPEFAARLTSSENAEDLWDHLRSIDREVTGAARGGRA